MTVRDELLPLERAGWEAFSTSGEGAARFYADNLARHILMLLPGSVVIDDREHAIHSMGSAPWTSFQLSEERVLELSAESAVVAYRATARRGETSYSALFSSTYVREDGAWKLALHQQTPAWAD